MPSWLRLVEIVSIMPVQLSFGQSAHWVREWPAQKTTTLRMLSPLCIRSKPLLISSSDSTWVIIGSIWILPFMYQSTILGTSVRPFATPKAVPRQLRRSEEHTSELQSLMRISYAVVCFKKNTINKTILQPTHHLYGNV